MFCISALVTISFKQYKIYSLGLLLRVLIGGETISHKTCSCYKLCF